MECLTKWLILIVLSKDDYAVDTVQRFFEYFYSRVTGHKKYMNKPTNTEVVMIRNFLKMLDGSVGDNYLFKYFSYQFYYWHDKDTRFGKGKIQLGWVIGQKAFDRYDSSKEEHWRSYSTTLYEKFGINKSDLVLSTNIEATLVSVTSHEENDKMLYHNTDLGLAFCIDYTSMYHENSDACKSCLNKQSCLSVMKNKYSMLYLRRMGK